MWLLCVWHAIGSWNNNGPLVNMRSLGVWWGVGVGPCFPAHDRPLGGAGFHGLFLREGLWGLVLLVVWCVVGLLFENYIVNASIFIEKL